MMQYTRSIARMLHEEHMATIALLERVEGAIAAHRKAAPDSATPEFAGLLVDLAGAVEGEIETHFAFEQEHLFTRLGAGGDMGMTHILQGEHDVILPLGREVAAIARAALKDGFGEDSWIRFRRLAGELAERMVSHIQKEEMGMLPALEDLLDDEADMEVTSLYAAAR